MNGLEPGMDILELSDWDFRATWIRLSIDDRAAIGAPGFDRFRSLSLYDRDAAARRLELVSSRERPEPQPCIIPSNVIDWHELTGDPPAFPWIMDHWLSWHPTLLAGRGGIGKSLLIQQIATCLATGLPTWCPAVDPLRVLYWACEDDRDQLWRRQSTICKRMQIGFDRLGGLIVDARYGLENTLMSSEFGRPMWTAQIELLRQQVNDMAVDVLIVDNIGHTFGANENVRHDVTQFLNGIAGLVVDRPFCPILLGHPSKAIGSEFSGSTAWENAVRMRWYLDDKLPDQKGEADQPDPDYRVLAKRKTNYTRLDYVQFKFDAGVLVPEALAQGEPGIIKGLRINRAKAVVHDAIVQLARRNIYGNNNHARNYLPKIIIENGLSEGYSRAELEGAIRTLMFDQELEECEVSRNAARKPIIGLKRKIT